MGALTALGRAQQRQQQIEEAKRKGTLISSAESGLDAPAAKAEVAKPLYRPTETAKPQYRPVESAKAYQPKHPTLVPTIKPQQKPVPKLVPTVRLSPSGAALSAQVTPPDASTFANISGPASNQGSKTKISIRKVAK